MVLTPLAVTGRVRRTAETQFKEPAARSKSWTVSTVRLDRRSELVARTSLGSMRRLGIFSHVPTLIARPTRANDVHVMAPQPADCLPTDVERGAARDALPARGRRRGVRP